MAGKGYASSVLKARLLDGLFPSQDEAHARRYRDVGQFLRRHRLAPTPTNYALAHAVVEGVDAPTIAAVEQATFGDVRLTQAAADAIAAGMRGSPAAQTEEAAASIAALVASIDTARTRFEHYAGIVDTSRADAEAYGDALASGAAILRPTAPAQGEVLSALMALTQSMVEKTRDAEEQLRAAAVEMKDLRVSLAAARQDAETDPLTQLPNRRAFEARFAACAASAGSQPMALALCDIDRFKAVNDRHGHDVGDRVIRLIGRELAQGCHDAFVARFGGEEFVLLFAGLTPAEASGRLDATRAAIYGRSFRVSGTGAALEDLSFSGGVVAVTAGDTMRDIVRRADAALYRAKQTGRNRVELG